jgi:hypothetical protein
MIDKSPSWQRVRAAESACLERLIRILTDSLSKRDSQGLHRGFDARSEETLPNPYKMVYVFPVVAFRRRQNA